MSSFGENISHYNLRVSVRNTNLFVYCSCFIRVYEDITVWPSKVSHFEMCGWKWIWLVTLSWKICVHVCVCMFIQSYSIWQNIFLGVFVSFCYIGECILPVGMFYFYDYIFTATSLRLPGAFYLASAVTVAVSLIFYRYCHYN